MHDQFHLGPSTLERSQGNRIPIDSREMEDQFKDNVKMALNIPLHWDSDIILGAILEQQLGKH